MINNFPDYYGFLLYRKLLTRADLEVVIANPKNGPYTSERAKRDLAEGTYLYEVEPNKALVPTPTSVTPAAGAPVAPAAGAEHL